MPEYPNDPYETLHRRYNAWPAEKRLAFLWLLENFELVDQITDTHTLSESDIQNLLPGYGSKTSDCILKFIRLFHQFKQEQSAADSTEG